MSAGRERRHLHQRRQRRGRPPGSAPPSWFARHKVLTTVLVIVRSCSSSVRSATTTSRKPHPSEEPTTVAATPSPEAEPERKTKDRDDARRAEPKQRIRRYAVLRVIDGDTVELDYKGGTTVRVIGIDTPETVSPSVPDECGGQAASNTAQPAARRRARSHPLRLDPGPARRLRPAAGVPDDPGCRRLRHGDAQARACRRGHLRLLLRDAGPLPGGRGTCEANGPKHVGQVRRPGHSHCGSCRSQILLGPTAPPGTTPASPPTRPISTAPMSDGPIAVTGSDPHGLDAEGDGIACE